MTYQPTKRPFSQFGDLEIPKTNSSPAMVERLDIEDPSVWHFFKKIQGMPCPNLLDVEAAGFYDQQEWSDSSNWVGQGIPPTYSVPYDRNVLIQNLAQNDFLSDIDIDEILTSTEDSSSEAGIQKDGGPDVVLNELKNKSPEMFTESFSNNGIFQGNTVYCKNVPPFTSNYATSESAEETLEFITIENSTSSRGQNINVENSQGNKGLMPYSEELKNKLDAFIPTNASGKKERIPISKDWLERNGYFDIGMMEAARRLGIGLTKLKSICRELDVPRWPYRHRNSMRKLIKTVENDPEIPDKDKEKFLLEIKMCLSKCYGPTKELANLRQRFFKKTHEVRKRKR